MENHLKGLVSVPTNLDGILRIKGKLATVEMVALCNGSSTRWQHGTQSKLGKIKVLLEKKVRIIVTQNN